MIPEKNDNLHGRRRFAIAIGSAADLYMAKDPAALMKTSFFRGTSRKWIVLPVLALIVLALFIATLTSVAIFARTQAKDLLLGGCAVTAKSVASFLTISMRDTIESTMTSHKYFESKVQQYWGPLTAAVQDAEGTAGPEDTARKLLSIGLHDIVIALDLPYGYVGFPNDAFYGFGKVSGRNVVGVSDHTTKNATGTQCLYEFAYEMAGQTIVSLQKLNYICPGVLATSRPWYKDGVGAGTDATFGELYQFITADTTSPTISITVSAAYYGSSSSNNNNQLLAVIAADVDLSFSYSLAQQSVPRVLPTYPDLTGMSFVVSNERLVVTSSGSEYVCQSELSCIGQKTSASQYEIVQQTWEAYQAKKATSNFVFSNISSVSDEVVANGVVFAMSELTAPNLKWQLFVAIPDGVLSVPLTNMWSISLAIICVATIAIAAGAVYSVRRVEQFTCDGRDILMKHIASQFSAQARIPSVVLGVLLTVAVSFMLYKWQQHIISISNIIAEEHGRQSLTSAEVIMSLALDRQVGVVRLLKQNVLWLVPELQLDSNSSVINSIDAPMPSSLIEVVKNIHHHFGDVAWASVGFKSGTMVTAGHLSSEVPFGIEIVDGTSRYSDAELNPMNMPCLVPKDLPQGVEILPTCPFVTVQRPWYITSKNMTNGDVRQINPYKWQDNGVSEISFATPMVTPLYFQGQYLGAISVDYDMQFLNDLLSVLISAFSYPRQIERPENVPTLFPQGFVVDEKNCLYFASNSTVFSEIHASTWATEDCGYLIPAASSGQPLILKTVEFLTKFAQKGLNSIQPFLGDQYTPSIFVKVLEKSLFANALHPFRIVLVFPTWEILNYRFAQTLVLLAMGGGFITIYITNLSLRGSFLLAFGRPLYSAWEHLAPTSEPAEKIQVSYETRFASPQMEKVYDLALTHVVDALERRPLRHFLLDPSHLWAYKIYRHWLYNGFISCACIFHLCLSFMEPPYDVSISDVKILSAEGIIIAIYIFDSALCVYQHGWFRIRKDPKVHVVFPLIITTITTLMFIVIVSRGSKRTPHLARFLRPIFAATRFRAMKHAFVLFIRAVRGIVAMIVLLVSFIFASSVIGVGFFQKEYDWQESIYGFWAFQDAAITQFHMLTTEPYPEIMINKKTGIPFFLVFILCSFIFFVPGLIASFYHIYKGERIGHFKRQRSQQIANLVAAFYVLDVGRKGELSETTFLGIMHRVLRHIFPLERKDLSRLDALALRKLREIDADQNGTISRDEFCNLFRHFFKIFHESQMRNDEEQFYWLRRFLRRKLFTFECSGPRKSKLIPNFFFSSYSKLLVMAHIFTNACNGIAYMDAFEGTYGWTPVLFPDNNDVFVTLNVVFVSFHIVELVIKAIVWGPFSFWRRGVFDKFDLIVIFSVFVAMVFVSIQERDQTLIAAIGTIACVRIFTVVEATALIVKSFLSVVPQVSSVGAITLLVIHFFATIGTSIFSSLPDPKEWKANFSRIDTLSTSLLSEHLGGFSSFSSAVATLVQLFIAANWGTQVFPVVQYFGWTAHIYFILFMFFGNFLLANLFVGMVLDAFVFRRNSQEAALNEMKLFREFRKRVGDNRQKADRTCCLCLSPVEPEDRTEELLARWTATQRNAGMNSDEVEDVTAHCHHFGVSEMACGHRFHTTCLTLYEYKRGECPRCRMDRAELEEAEEEIDGEIEVYLTVSIEDVMIRLQNKLEEAAGLADELLKFYRVSGRFDRSPSGMSSSYSPMSGRSPMASESMMREREFSDFAGGFSPHTTRVSFAVSGGSDDSDSGRHYRSPPPPPRGGRRGSVMLHSSCIEEDKDAFQVGSNMAHLVSMCGGNVAAAAAALDDDHHHNHDHDGDHHRHHHQHCARRIPCEEVHGDDMECDALHHAAAAPPSAGGAAAVHFQLDEDERVDKEDLAIISRPNSLPGTPRSYHSGNNGSRRKDSHRQVEMSLLQSASPSPNQAQQQQQSHQTALPSPAVLPPSSPRIRGSSSSSTCSSSSSSSTEISNIPRRKRLSDASGTVTLFATIADLQRKLLATEQELSVLKEREKWRRFADKSSNGNYRRTRDDVLGGADQENGVFARFFGKSRNQKLQLEQLSQTPYEKRKAKEGRSPSPGGPAAAGAVGRRLQDEEEMSTSRTMLVDDRNIVSVPHHRQINGESYYHLSELDELLLRQRKQQQNRGGHEPLLAAVGESSHENVGPYVHRPAIEELSPRPAHSNIVSRVASQSSLVGGDLNSNVKPSVLREHLTKASIEQHRIAAEEGRLTPSRVVVTTEAQDAWVMEAEDLDKSADAWCQC